MDKARYYSTVDEGLRQDINRLSKERNEITLQLKLLKTKKEVKKNSKIFVILLVYSISIFLYVCGVDLLSNPFAGNVLLSKSLGILLISSSLLSLLFFTISRNKKRIVAEALEKKVWATELELIKCYNNISNEIIEKEDRLAILMQAKVIILKESITNSSHLACENIDVAINHRNIAMPV